MSVYPAGLLRALPLAQQGCPIRGTIARRRSNAPPDCHCRPTRHRPDQEPANPGCRASYTGVRDSAASAAWFSTCLSIAATLLFARSNPCHGQPPSTKDTARYWLVKFGWQSRAWGFPENCQVVKSVLQLLRRFQNSAMSADRSAEVLSLVVPTKGCAGRPSGAGLPRGQRRVPPPTQNQKV